jgi:hypothetical protein
MTISPSVACASLRVMVLSSAAALLTGPRSRGQGCDEQWLPGPNRSVPGINGEV